MMSQAVAYNDLNQMESMNPVQLTVLAYDRVIKDLRQARNHWLNKMEDQAILCNQHAQDLITELLLGLDYEDGGEIARNLSKLYDFALRHLVSIGSESDAPMYDHLINIFGELREAWVQIGAQEY